ncbi:hypothetical protein ABFS82_06G133800 [Erythranthe guttata]|uniref:uncharacterized protein LOC105965666 n=1 Tax=Erythranthe guttata TaxID=4155 RepID=UPI00064D88E8|nr:PREDICTED: uncharacterized protein LOC105965666 [Erythranthe guttata]|eukprot:XP_012845688.1 PREDICTED: uncharacterized protein LOC105965666 [Erythranthe guttata]
MPHPKPINNEEQNPTNTPRRSPRFLHINQTAAENRATPNPSTRKIRTPVSFSAPTGSAITTTQKRGVKDTKSRSSTKSSKGSAKLDPNLSRLDSPTTETEKRVTRSSIRRSRFASSLKNDCNEISRKTDKKVVESKDSNKSSNGCRRSARLHGGANVSKKNVEVLDYRKQNVVEKMVTRSSVCGNRLVYIDLCDSSSDEDSGKTVRLLSKKEKPKIGADSCSENVEKRVTRSSNRTNTIKSVEKLPKGNGELSKICTSKKVVKDCGVEMGSGDKNRKENKNIGDKRKRCEVEECKGWSEEQELALRKAYFTVKPTPRFWKEVARMVPGKSANECFDRIHLDHLTPIQPKKRSRPNKKKEQSPLAFSASKLLSPAKINIKKLRSRKRTFLAQKTVRQILQKQQNEDQDYEADLFDILESTTVEPSLDFIQEGTSSFASPTPNQGSKHQYSRLNSSKKAAAAFVSPPVLKQIKNKALHEKYIDQLHCREAKRKAESLRVAKWVEGKNDKSKSRLEMNFSVKAAKDALVLDAQDAISQLRRIQSCTNDDTDDDDNASYGDEDEDEF